MKPRILSSARLCIPLAALLTAQSASAVDFYWKGKLNLRTQHEHVARPSRDLVEILPRTGDGAGIRG